MGAAVEEMVNMVKMHHCVELEPCICTASMKDIVLQPHSRRFLLFIVC